MRKNKYIFPAFSFYDRTGIQNFLEQKAMEGWMLEKMSAFGWRFRRIAPQRVSARWAFLTIYISRPFSTVSIPKTSRTRWRYERKSRLCAPKQMSIFCSAVKWKSSTVKSRVSKKKRPQLLTLC